MRWVVVALLLVPLVAADIETAVWPIEEGLYGILVEGTMEGQPGDLITLNVRIPSNITPEPQSPETNVTETYFEPKIDKKIPSYYLWFVAGITAIILALVLIPEKRRHQSRVSNEVAVFMAKRAEFKTRPTVTVSAQVRDAAESMVRESHAHCFIGDHVLSERDILQTDDPRAGLKNPARPISKIPLYASGSLQDVGKAMRTRDIHFVVHGQSMFTVSDWIRAAGGFPFVFARQQEAVPIPGVRMVMRPPKMVRPDASFSAVLKALYDDDLLVIMDREPIGVVTRQDVLRELLKARNPDHVHARDVMSTSLSAVREDMDALALCGLMADKGFEAMPVIFGGEVVGVVHTRDLFPIVFDFLVRIQNASRDGEIKD